MPLGSHPLLATIGLVVTLLAAPAQRVETPSAPIPVYLAPPSSIDDFWRRLGSPDFVLLNGAHYQDLVRAAGPAPSTTAAEPVISRLTIRGDVSTRSGSLVVEYTATNPTAADAWVRVGLEGLVITSAREGEKPVPIRSRGGGYDISVTGRGEHTIAVATDVPVSSDGDERRLSVPIPLAATTRIDLALADSPAEVVLGGVEPIVPKRGRVVVTIAPRPRVDLTWRPPPGPSADLPPLLTSQGEIAVDLTQDSIRSRARWSVTAIRGTCRALTFTTDRAEELTEVELDGRPQPIDRKVVGESATVSIPLADPLRVGMPARSVTLLTRRKLDASAGASVTIRGHALADAQLQTGAISVTQVGPIWVDGIAGRGLRRIDPASELPADLLSRPGTILAYRFVEQPIGLTLRVEPSAPRIEYRGRTSLVLTRGSARADAAFDFKTTPGRVFEIGFVIPDRMILDPIASDDVVESFHIDDDVPLAVVRLTAKARNAGEFTIRLRGRTPWSTGPDVRIGLVAPVDATPLGCRVAIAKRPEIVVEGPREADGFRRDSASTALDPPVPADRSAGLEPGAKVYRYDGALGGLSLGLDVLATTTRAETDLRITVGRAGIETRQTVRLDAVHGLLASVEFEVPTSAEPGWSVDGPGLSAPRLQATAPDGSTRYRSDVEGSPVASIPLRMRFQTPLGGPGRFASIRLVPEPTGPVRLSASAEPGVTLNIDPTGWEPRIADPSPREDTPARVWEHTGPVGELPGYRVSVGSRLDLPNLVVGRTYLRTLKIAAGLRTTATYRLDVHGSEVSLTLPDDARWIQARVDGEPVKALDTMPDRPGARIGLPGTTEPSVLTVEYAISATSPRRWTPPTLDGAVPLHSRWEIVLPDTEAILGVPAGWSDANEWYWDVYVWKRRAAVSHVALAEWAGGAWGTEESIASGHSYLFSRLDGPGPLSAAVVSRSWLAGVCSGLVGLVGIVLVLMRRPYRGIGAAVAGAAVLISAGWDLQLTLQCVQSGALGVVLVGVAVALQRVVDPRRRAPLRFGETTRTVSPNPSAVTASGGVVNAGSDDSTAIRPRPPSVSGRIVVSTASLPGRNRETSGEGAGE